MVLDCQICQEIVPLRKICRRPETDYRLQQLHAVNEAAVASVEQQKSSMDAFTVGGVRPTAPSETVPKQQNIEAPPHPAPPVIQIMHPNVPVPSQAPVLEPKKAETGTVINLGNSNVPLAAATITNSTVTTVVPSGTGEKVSEGRATVDLTNFS